MGGEPSQVSPSFICPLAGALECTPISTFSGSVVPSGMYEPLPTKLRREITVGCIVIQPPSMLSSPSITASAMKVSSPSVSMSGTRPRADEISASRPTLAPSNRYQIGAYTVAYTPCSTARLDSWIWLTSHLAQYRLLCTGQLPGFMRGSTSQRMPADSSAVHTISTPVAGKAIKKYLTS